MIFVRSTLTIEHKGKMNSKYLVCYDMTIFMKNYFKMSLIMNEKRCAQKQNKLYKEFSGSSINPS